MKKIGIYLSVGPHAGGSFQYCINAMKYLNQLNKKNYRVIIFASNSYWIKKYKNKYKIIKINKKDYKEKFLNYFFYLLEFFKLFKFFNNIFCKNIKNINSEKCDIVIFPAQEDISSKIYSKSISVIHDLMHRYENKFREYNFIEKIRRDIQYKKICKYSFKIFVDSNLGSKQLRLSYNVSSSKIIVVNFEVPEYLKVSKKINIFKKYKIPKSKFIFYPAQFWEHKNHLNLLKAFKLINKFFKNINLVLLGVEKNNLENIKKEINVLKIKDNVFIIGYIDNYDIYSFYKKAEMMTYVSFCGPTNIPPLEAMYVGCPLICSKVYAMPEQVNKGGLLVNPRSHLDIYKKMKIILKNHSIKKSIIKNGYKQLKKNRHKNFGVGLNKVLNDF